MDVLYSQRMSSEPRALATRRQQAIANNAIEGVSYSEEHEAMFEAFDAECLSHEERIERIRQRVTAPRLSAE